MDRLKPRLVRWLGSSALLALLVATVGCQGPLLTAMYLMGAADTQAEFKGLRKQRVVVVCQPLVQLKCRDMNASKQIGREVGKLLRKNAKCQVVNHDKVAEWLDNNASDDCLEIGRALDANMVVAVELLDFNIYQGQTLYQGKANYVLKVYDCETGDVVFEKTPDPSIWPPNAGIATSDKQESQFRRNFVAILSDEIARHFYSHDQRSYFAGDAAALD